MSFTATAVLNVTPLPDSAVWFANAAAWLNYWRNQSVEITVDGADTTLYVPSPYDANSTIYNFNVDGMDQFVPSQAAFNSLKLQLATLDASYQSMRNELKAAGIITNAQ